MKKVLSTLMMLVMMLCFNTRLHAFTEELTVMQSCAIIVFYISCYFIGYQFGISKACNSEYQRGLSEQTEINRQNVEELQRTISVLKDAVKRKSSELYACKDGRS